MNIEKKLENGVLTLAVGGRLDTNTSPELEAEVTTEGVSEIVFDFAALEYISENAALEYFRDLAKDRLMRAENQTG